ncbi:MULTISPECIES: hypothetical protein [Streptomyces]|uniref:Uncharacterized protein n=1 Tax=Streptomyces canarius TaxID=285453 RepID=A0ABQ3D8G2_9ACTN|nr:hypothetical protein [Streptomyces canarius]GHA65787.1 hypothetical protein GCM10010345_82080 [Streptomyces canarius]
MSRADIGDRTRRDLERLVQRAVWLLPNAFWGIGRSRLSQWAQSAPQGRLPKPSTKRPTPSASVSAPIGPHSDFGPGQEVEALTLFTQRVEDHRDGQRRRRQQLDHPAEQAASSSQPPAA